MHATPHVPEAGPLSVAEYEILPEEPGYRLELSRGWLVREPAPGMEHSGAQMELAIRLRRHLDQHGGGRAFIDCGFTLSERPPTVRIPDLAFVASARLPEAPLPRGFFRGAPDLAVEIVSPSNTAADLQAKVLEYLEAGARLVWVLYPGSRSAVVYRSAKEIRVVAADEALEGEDLLPGLKLPLAELFGT